MNVVGVTEKLLSTATLYAGDGDLSAQEQETLRGLISNAKNATKELSIQFDKVRKTMKSPISSEMLSENFFALTLSSYARLVWEYTENIMEEPPVHQGIFADVADNVKSAWDVSAISERKQA